MSVDPKTISAAVDARLDEATGLLRELIAAPSLPGEEAAAMAVTERAFADVATVQRVPLDNTLRDDPDYCDVIEGLQYDGRHNLRVVAAGGDAPGLLLNAHVDTVPPSQGQQRPFEACIEDGWVVGRGACDDKGQIAAIWLAMAALKDLGAALPGDLVAHLVVEEENGGNGSLAMVRRGGERAAGCIVCEPTELKVLTSIRGAVWFRMMLRGRPGHSGQAARSRSALKMAIRVVEILEGYHRRLLDTSRGEAMFAKYDNPMPLTVGKLHAGNWPATAPGEACLEGVLGFLPNRTAAQVCEEILDAIRQEGGDELADHLDARFTYRHNASVCPPDHPLVETLTESIAAAGGSTGIDAMTASCDACFYSNRLGIPTVVFGAGSLSVAHSNQERIPLDELATAAKALATVAVR